VAPRPCLDGRIPREISRFQEVRVVASGVARADNDARRTPREERKRQREILAGEDEAERRSGRRRAEDRVDAPGLVERLDPQPRGDVEEALAVDGHARRAHRGPVVRRLEAVERLAVEERAVGSHLERPHPPRRGIGAAAER
jgi:hypothetical protein